MNTDHSEHSEKGQMTLLQNMFRFLRRQKFEILREDFLEELTSK